MTPTFYKLLSRRFPLAAYQMLHRFANAKRGERVEFHLAVSGIGTSQLQLKRLAELVGYGSVFRWKYEIVPDLIEMNKFAWKDLITLIEM